MFSEKWVREKNSHPHAHVVSEKASQFGDRRSVLSRYCSPSEDVTLRHAGLKNLAGAGGTVLAHR